MKPHKNFLICLVAVVVALCLFVLPQETQAASISDLTFKSNSTKDGYIVSDCKESASGEMVVPATYNGLPVTGIGNDAFNNCENLTRIIIPASITSIGNAAFLGCNGLTDLQVADGNTIYHSDGNCIIETNSKTLIAGCNVSRIPSDGSVTRIGYSAFNGCRDLTSIIIPDSVISIEDGAFMGCKSLTEILIPDSVTSIGSFAFTSCTSLTSITIPDSVTNIGSSAFSSCTNLTGITIPDSVTVISAYMFDGCSNLTSVIMGNGVTNIGEYAFCRSASLTSITIPDSVTSINNGTFTSCVSLTSITIPDSVTTIGYRAFDRCNKFAVVTFCGTQAQWDAIEKGSKNDPLLNATLQLHNYENGNCTVCGHKEPVVGEIDSSEGVDHNDAVYLLLHIMFGEEYPLNGAEADIDGNGVVEQDDAVYLLLHSLFGELFYPLKTN